MEKKNSSNSSNILAEIEKWKRYYVVLGKTISEYSKELNVVLRLFCVQKLYKISLQYPATKTEIYKFFKLINITNPQSKEKYSAASILCFDDFADLVEKIYDSVEDLFYDEIVESKDFTNYLKIMAVYKLLRDLGDLAEAWGELDEKIEKFQNYCKFRVVDIYQRYQEYLKEPKTDFEKEWMELVDSVKKEKAEEKLHPELKELRAKNKVDLKKSQTIVQGSKNNQLSKSSIKGINSNPNDFHANSEFTTGLYPTLNFNSPNKPKNTNIKPALGSGLKRVGTYNVSNQMNFNKSQIAQFPQGLNNKNNKTVKKMTFVPIQKVQSSNVNFDDFPESYDEKKPIIVKQKNNQMDIGNNIVNQNNSNQGFPGQNNFNGDFPGQSNFNNEFPGQNNFNNDFPGSPNKNPTDCQGTNNNSNTPLHGTNENNDDEDEFLD